MCTFFTYNKTIFIRKIPHHKLYIQMNNLNYEKNCYQKIYNKKYIQQINVKSNSDNLKKLYLPAFLYFKIQFRKFYVDSCCLFRKKPKTLGLNLNTEDRREFIQKFFIFPWTILLLVDDQKLNVFPDHYEKTNQVFLRIKTIEEQIKRLEFLNYKQINKNTQIKSNYFSEETLTLVDFIYKLSYSFLLIGGSSFLTDSFSNRVFKRKDLPDDYEPEKISLYFKTRPDKIMIRFSQILLKCIKFSSLLIVDQFKPQNIKINHSNSTNNKILKTFDFLTYKQSNLLKLFNNIFNDKKKSKKFKSVRFENIMNFLKIQTKIKKNFYWQNHNNQRAKQLREIVSTLSPAFIKLAQAFASRPDVVGEKVAKELQRLQDDMPFFSNEIAFDFIKREIGAPSNKIFSEISQEPVAAASLGQVYRAILDGVPVAVKVQRPGLTELLALDIMIIRFLAFLAQKVMKIRTDLVAAVDEYAYRLFEELDYRKEASNMIKFRSLYGYMDRIYIPKVFLDYSSQHVLVMEWVDGERLVKNSVKVLQEDISLIEVGVRCSLVQLLEVGFLHCDPHGGNLIKTKDGRLAYIDFGLVSEIPESIRYSLIISILHLINREYKLLARDFTGLALIRNDDLDKEIQNFSSALSETFDNLLVDFDTFTFQDATEKIFRLTVRFPFILPPYFLNNLRAIATLEGIALMADSKFKISDVIYPYIINRLLTNPSPQFRAALENFLVNTNTLELNWERLQTLLKDPEWNEIFSDQSQNLSDTILSFTISSTGSFLRRKILRNIVNRINVYLNYLLFFQKKKVEKTDIFKSKTNSNYVNKKSGNIMNLIYYESKIYSVKNLFIFLKISFLSSILVFTEVLIKVYNLLINKIEGKGIFS
nr:BC1 family protein [Cryptomonas curvata]